MGATQHRPGSHSSRPKRTGAVALDDSIADGGSEIKRRGRANGALERANFAAKWPFSAPIGATGAVRGACEACVTGSSRKAKTSPGQSDISDKIKKPCHIAVFGHFEAFLTRFLKRGSFKAK